jgi:hypothetical protein
MAGRGDMARRDDKPEVDVKALQAECNRYKKALEDIARWGNVMDMEIAKEALSPTGDDFDDEESIEL